MIVNKRITLAKQICRQWEQDVGWLRFFKNETFQIPPSAHSNASSGVDERTCTVCMHTSLIDSGTINHMAVNTVF